MDKVRVDKWLWSVRIYKSRSIATEACKTGNIKMDGKNLKPSYLVSPGETLIVRKNGFNLVIHVVRLISKRVSAPLAAECYENQTSDEEMNKYNDWFVGKARPEIREKGTGRPTKRERRELDQYKDHQFEE